MRESRRLQLVVIGFLAAAAVLAPPVPAALCVLLLLTRPGPDLLRVVGCREPSVAAGLATSIVFLPLLLNLVWIVSIDRLLILGVLLAVNAGLVLCQTPQRRAELLPRAGRTPLLLSAIITWSAACVFLSLWLPRVFDGATQAAHDYVKHHAVVLSLVESRLPLQNMFYAGEPNTPYFYYHFFYLLAGAVVRISGCSIAFAFALTAAAVTAAFIGLVAALARYITGSAAAGTLAAACVSVVGGWDALPVAWNVLHGAAPPVTLDTWCPTPWRWHNLMTQFYWCPQHVAAMLAFLLATYWLRHVPLDRRWIFIAPLLALSIFGSSAYLAMTIFPAAAVAALWPLLRSGRAAGTALPRGYVAALALIAILGAALMLPSALGYREMAQRFEGGLTTTWDRFPLALLGRFLPAGPLANLVDLPWIMLLDMGLPVVALVLAGRETWRRLIRDATLRPLLIAAFIGPLAMFTLRSTVNPFDYSFRLAIMPTQVFAALVTGTLITEWVGARRKSLLLRGVLAVGVVLGLPVGLYEAPLSVLRSKLQQSPIAADAGAIRFLRALPHGTIVQGDPVSGERSPDRRHLCEMTDQRMGIFDPSHSHVRVFFPRDEHKWQEHFERVRAAFGTTSPGAAYDALRQLGVQFVLYGTVETKRFGPPGAFENERLFELVYHDDGARVYRLRAAESRGAGE